MIALTPGPKKLGQTVIVENRAGAGTAIGAAYVAKATADGYTLLMSSASTFTVNPAIRKTLPYDPVKSFEPIGIVSRVALVILLANPNVPVNNLKELVAAAKASPGKYAYASFGAGTSSHFAAEMALQAMGIRLKSPRALQGQRPGHDRPDGRAGALLLRHRDRRAAADQGRQDQGHRGHDGQAFGADARRADLCRVGLPVGRARQLGHGGRAAGPAAGGACPAREGAGRDGGRSGGAQGFAEQGVEPGFIGSAQAAAQLEAELPLMRAVAVRANIQPE